ncbi:MAG TPA: S8 family peptidase [Pseudobdellovibrionaceae bacterium]|mgnify:CR=1 FL=1|nr:S8 family peptidase [Pseudobdellovibrionaceae bacterium]
MDVLFPLKSKGFRLGSVLIPALFIISCSKEKTVQTVFKESTPQSKSQCAGSALANQFIVNWEDGRYTVEKSVDKDHFIKDFLEPRLEDIKNVEFDRHFQFHPKNLIEKSTTPPPQDWGQATVGAQKVWNQGIRGQGIRIAVIDSYVDTSHPYLTNNIEINTLEIPDNGIDDDKNGVIDDVRGAQFIDLPDNPQQAHSEHGSHVSGIIAGTHDSRFNYGMAPEAKIIPVQFIDDTGAGSIGNAILAVQYATQRKAQIINASWGGAPCVDTLKSALKAANDAGAIIVVAAGNESQDIDYYPVFPAAFNLSHQITVAASGMKDLMMAFSNSGFQLVQIASPGEAIFSSIPGGFAYMSGTSMAAPIVSGAAALLWSAHPQATAVEIKSALLSGVDIYPGHEFQVQTRGRLNVSKSLDLLK